MRVDCRDLKSGGLVDHPGPRQRRMRMKSELTFELELAAAVRCSLSKFEMRHRPLCSCMQVPD